MQYEGFNQLYNTTPDIHIMIVNRFSVVVATLAAVAGCVNCAGSTTVSRTTTGLGRNPIDGDDDELIPVCSSNYVYKEAHDGTAVVNIKDVISDRPRRLRRRRQQQQQQRINQIQKPPIAIVRQSESFVEFTVQNTTWFASAAASAGFDVAKNLPTRVFAKFPIDVFGSERCVMATSGGLSPPTGVVAASTEKAVMKTHCYGTTESVAHVRLYARFDDDTDNGTNGGAAVPACCPDDPLVDDSSSKVVEYVFELMCSPACDDNPIEYEQLRKKPSVVFSSELNAEPPGLTGPNSTQAVEQTMTRMADNHRTFGSFDAAFESGSGVYRPA